MDTALRDVLLKKHGLVPKRIITDKLR